MIKSFILITAVFLLHANMRAQKPGTEKWLRPRGFMYSFSINEQSKPYNGVYFTSYFYVPATNKPLRLDVSSDGRFAYQVQVSGKKGLLFDKYIFRRDTVIFLPASGTDTLNLFFIARVPARGSVGMKYALLDADTASTILSATPKKAFEQIINATQTNFTNLLPAGKNRTAGYTIENGGIAPFWTTIEDNSYKQTIGREFTQEQALADIKNWAKQMEGWLKPYGAIESKFYSSDDVKKTNTTGIIQRHEIIKKNKAGDILFRIKLNTMQMEKYYNTVEITAY